MGDNVGKGVILIIGLVFVFGALYQVLNAPASANAIVNAGAGDVYSLEQIFTGRQAA